jgi:hypothetical protein
VKRSWLHNKRPLLKKEQTRIRRKGTRKNRSA